MRQAANDLSSRYVRIRHNDQPVVLPGYARPSNHLEGDTSFCTLVGASECVLGVFANNLQSRIKEIVEIFTPLDWRAACLSNLGNFAYSNRFEPAGH